MAFSAGMRYRASTLLVASVGAAGVPMLLELSAKSGSRPVKERRTVKANCRSMWWLHMLQRQRVECEETASIFDAALEPTAKMLAAEQNIDIIGLLRNSDLLYALRPESLQKVVDQVRHRIWVKADTVLIEDGQLHDVMVIVGAGKLSEVNREGQTRTLGPGEVFGETSAITKRTSGATLRVLSKTALVIVVERSALASCLDSEEWETIAAVANTKDIENVSHDFLAEIPMFHGASNDFLRACAKRLKFVSFAQDDTVFTVGEADNKGMYYIKTGKMGVYDLKGQFATLGEKMCVGESMLLAGPGATRGATVRALQHIEAYQLARNEFLKLATEFPLEFNKIRRQSRDSRSYPRKASFRKMERIE